MIQDQILPLFPGELRREIVESSLKLQNIQEIRIRAGRPVVVMENGKEHFGRSCVSLGMIRNILEKACGYSAYAFEEEIRSGYLTIEGGHRIGISGRVVLDGEYIQTIKYVSSLNIRIAHAVTGCADKWRDYCYQGRLPCHILLISPPGCGKTTLLRDMIRMLSKGNEAFAGVTVGVADERSEIAGCCQGKYSFDLGPRTDVLDGCPKILGIEMLLRSMSPRVVAVDEIGGKDVESIEKALCCGCKVIAAMHGAGIHDFINHPGFARIAKERVFERYMILKSGQTPGKVAKIYDRDFKILWEECVCT